MFLLKNGSRLPFLLHNFVEGWVAVRGMCSDDFDLTFLGHIVSNGKEDGKNEGDWNEGLKESSIHVY